MNATNLTITPTIEPLVLQKILYWVRRADKLEVSGFGKIIAGAGTLHVMDAMLIEQENSRGLTEINAEALARAMFQTKDQPGTLNFWWHSHGHGPVFWSQTDETTMRELGGKGFLLSTVFNVFAEMKTALFVAEPFPHFVDDLALKQETIVELAALQQWEANYVAQVTERKTLRAYLSKKQRRALQLKEDALASGIGRDDFPERTQLNHGEDDWADEKAFEAWLLRNQENQHQGI